jgi:8-amino-7-oxononanoate synthase
MKTRSSLKTSACGRCNVPEDGLNELRDRLQNELEFLRDRGQYRELSALRGINLSSNDYLGLAADPRLKEAVLRAVEKSRTMGSTGSRLLSGNTREWEELEKEFAGFAGTEAALYFGSGYAANVGLLSSILRPGDVVYSDALNHASLIDGMRLSGAKKVIFPHCDAQFLERELRNHSSPGGARVIVTESVYSMEGDMAPLPEYFRLAREYHAGLVVDEAHATGVRGPEGRGAMAELGLERDALAIVHTCGKALASAGAFVCGTAVLKDFLVNRARTFIFSTAMPPYLAGQIRAALEFARAADDRRKHLGAISDALRARLGGAGVKTGTSTTQIVPVYSGSNEAALHVAGVMQANGFAAKAIRPPTVPPGTSRIRISLTSAISATDVERLADAIVAACNSLPETSPASAAHA